MKDLLETALLYDFYGELLTSHQRQIYEDIMFNDLSLSEAAEELGITRQGVHDMVRRCTAALNAYEEKLGLVGKFQATEKLVREIRRQAGLFRETGDSSCIDRIEQIAEEIEAL